MEKEINHRLKLLRQWDTEAVPPAYTNEETEEFVKDVLEHWAPMAERLGLQQEAREIEELGMKLGFPDEYRELKQLLLESETKCETLFRTFALPIRTVLDVLGIDYVIQFRMKTAYSVWRKMRLSKKQLADVYDLFATRIIYKPQQPSALPGNDNPLHEDPEVNLVMQHTIQSLDPERFTCWRIYTCIAMIYRIQTDRIKNWITHPKPSGYQALHLTVMGPEKHWVEVQIRSERMHYEAEHGNASHWMYKHGGLL